MEAMFRRWEGVMVEERPGFLQEKLAGVAEEEQVRRREVPSHTTTGEDGEMERRGVAVCGMYVW